MYVIDVIPIAKGITRETLSYFTSKEIVPGGIVTVLIRNKKIRALVVSATSVADSKTKIKSSEYALRKIENLEKQELLLPSFIAATTEAARYFATTTGVVLHALLPKAILESLPKTTVIIPAKETTQHTDHSLKYVIQTEEEERFSHYKSLIREEFAKKSSVLFILPTIEETERTAKLLEKGIEKYTFTMHGDVPRKDFLSRWNMITSTEHSILIVATGLGFCLPRSDIGTIIVDREASRTYKMSMRPFLDLRTFAEIWSKHMQARLLFGDNFLRVETLWRHSNDELIELSPLKYRSLSEAQQRIIDMRRYKSVNGTTFTVVSDELKELIRQTREKNERLFIFTVRRGLSPLTLCGDCGSVAYCEYCTSPVVVRTAFEVNVFVCNKCGAKRSAEERCKVCTSWKLVPLGIGIELVERELKLYFPDLEIFVVDKDRTPTRKRRSDTVSKFLITPSSILLGTEVCVSHIHGKIDNIAIISIDSLFSIPDFRIHEKILNLLLALRSLTSGTFLLQTRNIGEQVLEYATKGNLLDFYRREIAERKQFSFPPYSTLIKISRSGVREVIEKEMAKLSDHLNVYSPHVFPAFVAMIKGRYIMHALIKVPHGEWVDEKLLEKLTQVPPQFSINVDPESIL
ncbi:MAG: Uncharacterized protein G01um101448_816 [Parcubacteria group bacterium Gr01-1014_48]|nr:MAG: Uncharacterized protein Greene041614_996 [Parcubacteria group bacterium Greene0416_14]TSC73323.1 MAG: Uncharacterized protein G01um101448_816 [Parcubacteria group bacterium Gr01-1014_48]TSC99950.1 MAG: Uncharacterized protein Greene101415_1020 [Parcubacteria group bacterium Greene1014_15]TSD07412.1 MAG: Uncharacterized protein Greene07144_904 [Parcubacteria group bacterium Greene0714_4]